jgi:hypothetical protein
MPSSTIIFRTCLCDLLPAASVALVFDMGWYTPLTTLVGFFFWR